MNAEAIIVLLYIKFLKKTLKTFSPNVNWNRALNYSLYLSLGLWLVEIIFKVEDITLWVWKLFEVILIVLTFKQEKFEHARKVMLGLLPFIILLFFADVIEAIFPDFYLRADNYFDVAKTISLTWLVAMIWVSNRQRKAMEKERQKRLIEEEKHRLVEEQKLQLEKLVAERTQEITRQKEELETTLTELQSTQKQLIQSEKMASLGELTAGIAHEIQNPLNFVNNFSEVSVELLTELKQEMRAGNTDAVVELADDIENNLLKITHHGKRADGIVKGMLQHSRSSTGVKELTDINAIADEYFRLSYHGLRAKDKNFNAAMKSSFDEKLGLLYVIPQDIGRVLLNLFTNAFYAVAEKKKDMERKNLPYDPTVSVETKLIKNESREETIRICIKDNGTGIPQKVVDKIYQPFFTTKPSGKGTGLGLSLSYDIITSHNGTLSVQTKEGEFAEFVVQIPAVRDEQK